MGVFQCFLIVCSLLVLIQGSPKPPGENTDHGNKDITDIEEGLGLVTTRAPELSPELSPELPENWDQTKDDVSTLFLNRSDKTGLPYPMALTDDSYDGRPIREDTPPSPKIAPGTLEHIIMRSELYGEPPSMNRDNLRRKRANANGLRSDVGATHSRVSKMAPRYSAINRRKRDSSLRSDDIRHLLSLWEAEQRRNEEIGGPYYSPEQYLGQDYYDGSTNDRDDLDERWLDEPIYSPTHFSHSSYSPHISYQPKPAHNQYSREFPEIIPSEPAYLQNIEAIRRKRQWPGLSYKDRLSKRFMVAKKRSEPNYFRPREDMYTLNDLLRSSELNSKQNTYPIKRRMIL